MIEYPILERLNCKRLAILFGLENHRSCHSDIPVFAGSQVVGLPTVTAPKNWPLLSFSFCFVRLFLLDP